MPKIEEGMREQIAAFLPKALKTATKSYLKFSQEAERDDNENTTAKTFKEHHDACKVAIAHINLLIELAKWADIPTEELTKGMEQAEYAMIINKAQGELGR